MQFGEEDVWQRGRNTVALPETPKILGGTRSNSAGKILLGSGWYVLFNSIQQWQ